MTTWLEQMRGAARAAFEARGLPTRRVEAWKYSDLARAMERGRAGVGEGDALTFAPQGAHVIEILDGITATPAEAGRSQSLRSALAAPSPLVKEHLGRVAADPGHPILALNTALMEDGVVIHVPKGLDEGLIHLRYCWSANDTAQDGHHLRVLLVLEEGSAATVLETHEGPGAMGLATIVTEVVLQAGARLQYIRFEGLDAAARQSAVLAADLGRDAALTGFYLSRGAAFSRHEILAQLKGEGADVTLDGAYLVAGEGHCDNTTVIAHAVPHTTSRQVFRGVLSGAAHGVFQGRVIVEQGAQGTDARQQSRAVLLSRRAEIDTKPELEIFADDVKCAHGATAGELDPAALFFLRARGIPEKEARALLVEAFLEEALGALKDETLHAEARRFVRRWLDAHAGEMSDVGAR